MNSIDRFLLAIYMIVLTCVYCIFLLVPFGYPTILQSAGFVYNVFEKYQWYIFAAAILLILLNIKLVIGIITGDRVKKFGVIRSTENGEVNISNDAIKSMVIKVTSEISGIKDIKVTIKPVKDNVSIHIKTNIISEVNIPLTVKQIQENVKKYIEAMAEIPIGEVKVTIVDVLPAGKLRVQ